MLDLKLENYRRFLQPTSVSFKKGLTIIGGVNGAGKSTLIEALIYALYGKRGQADIRSDNVTQEVEVECELSIDNQRVRVYRSESKAGLWIDGVLHVQPVSGSITAVNRQISALLGGLTPEQFESTYVALQGDTAGLVEKQNKHHKRKEIIEGILQLEVLKEAVGLQDKRREETLAEIKAKGLLIPVLQLNQSAQEALHLFVGARKPEIRVQHAQKFLSILHQEIEQRQKALEEKREQLKEAEAKVRQYQEAHDKHQSELDKANGEYDAQKVLKDSYEELDKKIARAEGQIEQIDRSISELEGQIIAAEACFDAAMRYHQLEAEDKLCEQRLSDLRLIKERYTALLKAQKDVDDLDKEIQLLAAVDELLEQAQQLGNRLKQVWEDLQDDPTASDFRGWQAQKVHVDHEEKQALEALKTLQDHPDEARCPTCNQKFEEHTPEQRIQHLESWLKGDLPVLRAQLQKQERDLQQRGTDWQQAKQKALREWQTQSGVVTEALKEVQRRDNRHDQRERAEQALQVAQQKWDELEETRAYDSEEEQQLQGKQAGVEPEMQNLEKDARLYDQLTFFHEQLQSERDERQQSQDQLNDLKKEQIAVGYDSVFYLETELALSNARTALDNAKQMLRDATSEQDNCRRDIEHAQTSLRQAEQYKNEITEAFSNFQRQDRLFMLLRNFQDHYFTVNTRLVTSRATQLVLHAVNDQSILGLEFDGNNLYYRDASNHRRSVERLSGGEKALVGLCLRIALAERAQAITRTGKVRFLILDEVLSALDDERREAVQSIFEDVLHCGVFENIIMITHLDAVKQDWRANRLEVRKVDSKSSEVISLSFDGVEETSFEEIQV